MSSSVLVPARLRRVLLVSVMSAALTAGVGAGPALAVEDFPPDALNDSATATSGEVKIIDVLANDQNPDEDGLEITSLGTPTNGSVSTDGLEVTYTSAPGFVGIASFTYTVMDGGLATDTATVSVDVRACDPLADAIDVGGIVTGEEWIHCSSFQSVKAVGDMTPVMNMSGDSQALMTTGTVEAANPPNTLPNTGFIHNTEHRGAYDVSILELDLQVPTGVNCLGLELAFQSEEYPENVDSAFNDGFLAELDQSDWEVSGSSILAPNNFAFDGAGNIVSVNSSFFDDERVVTGTDVGTEYDGSTPLLEARTPIEPGPHTLYLSIFDATDHEFDSAVFMDRLRAFTAATGTCVRGAKQAPNALNDTLTTSEDSANSVNVLANDSDPDGDPITIIEETNGTQGSVTCSGSSCTYTPNANFNGTDSFTYRITDGFASDRATVSVTVDPVPDPPDAVNDSATTNEDAASTVEVLSNDSDVDGDALSVTGKTNGTHGSVTCSASSCTYTPDLDYSGPDSYTYTASDGNGGTDTATVNMTVNAVNDPPNAVNDSVTTEEDQAASLSVLANDDDADGDPLTVTSSTQPSEGSVLCTASSCEYTPDPNYNGPDSFTYTVSDGRSGTDTATVSITVSPSQDLPAATDDSAATDEDQPKAVSVLANDSDPDGDTLGVTDKTNGTHGTVDCSASSCTYTPDANWSGTDSFTYTLSDGNGGTDTATVDMTVNPVNDPPVAQDDSLTTDEDTAGDVSVLTNDADGAEGDALTVTSKTNGSNGSVSCTVSSCTYTPNSNFKGTDSFTYTVSDGNGGLDTASVSVTVNSVNDQPVATNDTLQTRVNRAKSVSVLTNDSDVDGDTLSISGNTNGGHGTVACSDGSCTYTPETGWSGSDSFTYTLSDGNGGSSTGTVSVTVAVNQGPTAALTPSPTTTVAEGQSVNFGANGSSDPDGEISSYDWSVSDGRTMSGTSPSIGFADDGTFEVTLEVCDDDNACDTATTTVTVDNVAPTPSFTSQPTTPLRINTNTSPTTQPGAPAAFTADATDPGVQDALTYEWDFGDGTSAPASSSPDANHAYKKLGRFTATVTVRDGDGGVTSATSQPVNVLPTGTCGKLKNAYWGKPGATATVVARTQFWYVKGKEKRKIRNAYINPGQVVKLQAKPGSRSQFQQVCINNKRYFRVEKVTGSLPKLNYEYLPEAALLRLS